jgi:chromosome segregation ATPase
VTALQAETQTHDWEADVASLLAELSDVQDELLAALDEKRKRLAERRTDNLADLEAREQELAGRLQACQARRQDLLTAARDAGLPSQSVRSLAAALPGERSPATRRQVDRAAARMRLVQQHCIANWVVAQQSLLHVSQLLEIIACGGQPRPTYSPRRAEPARGALVDHEA